MIGLYAGLRREEILALQWDSVYLDTDTPYLTKRLWPEEGVVDHAGIASALKEIGFDGVCTIEEFRPEYYEMSHEENVKKAAEVTRSFVQKYFG